MENFMVIWEALVPIYCLYYGFKIKKNPPKMGEKGLGTKLAMQSKEAWELANAYGANLCIIFGVITAALFIFRIAYFRMQLHITYSLILIAVELICIMSIVPLTNMKIKKTFGKKK